MNKFRSKLLLALISLIVAVLVGLGLLLGQLFLKAFYIENFNERMERELRYTASVLEKTGIHETLLRPETLIQIQEKLKVNITLLDLKGKLLYGSEEKKRIRIIRKQCKKLFVRFKGQSSKCRDEVYGQRYVLLWGIIE
ncbi:hypothetical protein GCM10020331_032520 [Ectobacillus funiculus]